jgi:hypothetical protein
MICGALACIRPTTLPLVFCVFMHLRLQLQGTSFRHAFFSVAAGFSLCIALTLVYMWVVNGIFHIVGYYHWDSAHGARSFSLDQPGEIPWFAPEQLPMWRLSLESVLGMNLELTTVGGWSMLVLLAGGMAGMVLTITRTVQRNHPSAQRSVDPLHNQVIWIGVFGFVQLVIHCFYHAYLSRNLLLRMVLLRSHDSIPVFGRSAMSERP